MSAKKVFRVRRNVTIDECAAIGVVHDGCAGELCQLDFTSPVEEGYEDKGGPCEAYHVTMLTGRHVGAEWWIPRAFLEVSCMFGEDT